MDAMVSLAAAKSSTCVATAAAAVRAADMAVVSARQGGAILEVVKALVARAQILEHAGEHRASLKEAAAVVGVARMPASPQRCSLRPSGVGRRGEFARRGLRVGGELTPKELEVLRLLATPVIAT